MQISELITLLKLGELKKLALKDNESDVLALINTGIVEIYKKFPLWRDSVAIIPVAGVKDYAFTGEDGNVPINLDESQLMLIEAVTATDIDGIEYDFIPTNSTRPVEFSTPQYNVLRMNSEYEKHTLEVEVRLAPILLTSTSDDIPLPPQFIEALSLYCGYKAHGSVNADVKQENNSYYMRYQKAIADILMDGQYPLDPTNKDLLSIRGFI